MKDSPAVRVSGMGFLSMLTLVFVFAKVTNQISWSWWLVFAPVLAPFAMVLAGTFLIFVTLLVVKR